MLKKLPGYILLGLFIIAQGGFYLGYTWKQEKIREAVTQQLLSGLADHQLQRIPLQTVAAGLHWQEEGHEFVLNGKLYDVARIVKENGQLVIYCLEDGKEETLLSDLARKIGTDDTGGQKLTIEKFHFSDWITDLSTTKMPFYSGELTAIIYPSYTETVQSRAGPVNVPPPDRHYYTSTQPIGTGIARTADLYPTSSSAAFTAISRFKDIMDCNGNPSACCRHSSLPAITSIHYTNRIFCEANNYFRPASSRPASTFFVQT